MHEALDVLVVTAARDQPDAVAVALKADAISVELDLVEPIRAVGDDGRIGRHQHDLAIEVSFSRPYCANALIPRLS